MVGEDQSETKHERVALPPPVKRRDHHMRKLVRISLLSNAAVLASANITQMGFTIAEESSPLNAFGVGLSSDAEPKHK